MSQVKISFHDFLIYRKEVAKRKKLPKILRLIILLIYLFAIVEAIIYKHYILALLLIIILLLVRVINPDKIGTKYIKHNYDSNKFLNSEFDIVLMDSIVKIKAGINQLKIAVYDIATIDEYNDFYYFEHFSGFKFFLPKDSLTKEEIKTVNIYKKKTEEKAKRFYSKITGKYK